MQRRARHLAMRATAMRLLFTVLVVVCTPVAAQQTAFDTYEHVRGNVFWKHFYVCGGTTVYCGLPFAAGQKLLDGRKLTIEHAYPADWIATYHDCENRDTCKITAYGRAAADLHNLWPAIGNINSSRQDKLLAEIPGERHRRFEDYCPDFERTSRSGETEAIVEPRDSVKGDMARSILHMTDSYGLPLPPEMPRDMLMRWHKQDPPTTQSAGAIS